MAATLKDVADILGLIPPLQEEIGALRDFVRTRDQRMINHCLERLFKADDALTDRLLRLPSKS